MIVKNILNNLRRFATSTLLNVVGLSVAFASAFVLLVQVDYDFSYNDGIPDAERIYRIDTPFWGGTADYQAIISYPHEHHSSKDQFFGAQLSSQSNSHIHT